MYQIKVYRDDMNKIEKKNYLFKHMEYYCSKEEALKRAGKISAALCEKNVPHWVEVNDTDKMTSVGLWAN